ncbi:hypothetical protein ABZR88_15040 [Mucilaginibacter yixingensis]|uniref:hypothetical protein n=1 Tax=Mucilaginibacter yixingensis TaxID=1295612 RepID=UPI000D2F9C03|nr:hypothetical protein [Mucilaginibacter yixingensis]
MKSLVLAKRCGVYCLHLSCLPSLPNGGHLLLRKLRAVPAFPSLFPAQAISTPAHLSINPTYNHENTST